jgi:PST family polysaccharide transporter
VAGIASQVAVAVPMAAMGADWWALIAASVVSQAVQVVALWRSCPWRPVRGVELAVLQPLWRFGGWSFAGSLLVWLYCWADMAALAHAQGPAAVGVYRAGNQLVDAVFAMIVSPLLPVLFGYFSSIKADTARIVDRVVHVQFMLTAVAVPVGIGLFLFADLVTPILGARWSEAAAVIAVVGLAHGLSWSMGANNEAFKAIGRPDVQPKIMALSLLYFIPVYYAVAPHGLLALAWAKFCLFVGSQVWDLLALRFLLGVPLMQSLRRLAPVFPAAVTYTTIYVQAAALLPGDGLVLGPLLFAALVLGANVVLFRRSLAARTWPWRLDAPVAN